MIISCTTCKKNFEVDSNLIPDQGRLIQCGSCNHKWFFKIKLDNDNSNEINATNSTPSNSNDDEKIKININNNYDLKKNDNINLSEEIVNKEEISTNKPKNKNNYLRIFNLTLVFIISFIALILLIETFKLPISRLIPDIDNILKSLYETLKDVHLFFIDLI